MAFDKIVFYKKVEEWILDNGWQNNSGMIDDILHANKLELLPYKPRFLINKDGLLFFVQFFQKGKPKWHKKTQSFVSGFDLYKYRLLLYLQDKANIQAGCCIWYEEDNKFYFRQLDQLPKPIVFFGGMNCRWKEIDKRTFKKGFHCGLCFETHPLYTEKCIKRRNRRKEMAMWNIKEFAEGINIQTKLI